jgi:hypothetical protein
LGLTFLGGHSDKNCQVRPVKDINIGAGYQTNVEGSKRASVVLAVSHLASTGTGNSGSLTQAVMA